MRQLQTGAIAVRDEVDLHRGRAGREGATFALPPPREHDAAEWRDLHELAPHHVLRGDGDPVDAAGPWIQRGVHAFPARELVRVGEEREHGFGPCVDLDRPH